MKNGHSITPQGIRACWRFWRHCMCTSGWYPVLVAPVVTIGFFLSLYSTLGCKFIDIDIGFTPSNLAWNQSEANIGLFYYYQEGKIMEIVEVGSLNEIFHSGCTPYSSTFEETFIDKDRTWKVSRVMAWIALTGSLLASATCWLIVFFPVPVNWVWPAVVLPSSMLAFIGEGSKFLIFDVALCRNSVWYPSGIDSLPAKAETCSLGEAAYVGIAAVAVNLIALLSVCLRAPDKRSLDPQFALQNEPNECDRDFSEKDSDSHNDGFDGVPSVLDDDVYTPGPSPSSVIHTSQDSCNIIDPSLYESSSLGSNEVYTATLKNSMNLQRRTGTQSVNKSTGNPINLRISESRLSVMSKMQLDESSETADIIDKLVSDLDSSLQEPPA